MLRAFRVDQAQQNYDCSQETRCETKDRPGECCHSLTVNDSVDRGLQASAATVVNDAWRALTEMACAIADKTAIAPNKEPDSELHPVACKQTAPRECIAGLPPDVKEFKHESAVNTAELDDPDIPTNASASPSTAREYWASR